MTSGGLVTPEDGSPRQSGPESDQGRPAPARHASPPVSRAITRGGRGSRPDVSGAVSVQHIPRPLPQRSVCPVEVSVVSRDGHDESDTCLQESGGQCASVQRTAALLQGLQHSAQLLQAGQDTRGGQEAREEAGLPQVQPGDQRGRHRVLLAPCGLAAHGPASGDLRTAHSALSVRLPPALWRPGLCPRPGPGRLLLPPRPELPEPPWSSHHRLSL